MCEQMYMISPSETNKHTNPHIHEHTHLSGYMLWSLEDFHMDQSTSDQSSGSSGSFGQISIAVKSILPPNCVVKGDVMSVGSLAV